MSTTAEATAAGSLRRSSDRETRPSTARRTPDPDTPETFAIRRGNEHGRLPKGLHRDPRGDAAVAALDVLDLGNNFDPVAVPPSRRRRPPEQPGGAAGRGLPRGDPDRPRPPGRSRTTEMAPPRRVGGRSRPPPFRQEGRIHNVGGRRWASRHRARPWLLPDVVQARQSLEGLDNRQIVGKVATTLPGLLEIARPEGLSASLLEPPKGRLGLARRRRGRPSRPRSTRGSRAKPCSRRCCKPHSSSCLRCPTRSRRDRARQSAGRGQAGPRERFPGCFDAQSDKAAKSPVSRICRGSIRSLNSR